MHCPYRLGARGIFGTRHGDRIGTGTTATALLEHPQASTTDRPTSNGHRRVRLAVRGLVALGLVGLPARDRLHQAGRAARERAARERVDLANRVGLAGLEDANLAGLEGMNRVAPGVLEGMNRVAPGVLESMGRVDRVDRADRASLGVRGRVDPEDMNRVGLAGLAIRDPAERFLKARDPQDRTAARFLSQGRTHLAPMPMLPDRMPERLRRPAVLDRTPAVLDRTPAVLDRPRLEARIRRVVGIRLAVATRLVAVIRQEATPRVQATTHRQNRDHRHVRVSRAARNFPDSPV